MNMLTRALVFTLALSGACTASASAPAALQGTWRITQVAVDAADPRGRSSEPNDPRLLGALLTVPAHGPVDYPFANACDQMQWKTGAATTLAELVRRNVRVTHGERVHPTLSDYGLDGLGNPRLAPVSAWCTPSPASGGKPTHWTGPAWMAPLGPDRLLAGDSDTVLVFDRITAATPVAPSFPCTGSLSPTESRICSSQALAGRDRGVAAAYDRALRRQGPSGTAAIRQEQAAWLKTRDACGADEDCIMDRMIERITALMSY